MYTLYIEYITIYISNQYNYKQTGFNSCTGGPTGPQVRFLAIKAYKDCDHQERMLLYAFVSLVTCFAISFFGGRFSVLPRVMQHKLNVTYPFSALNL